MFGGKNKVAGKGLIEKVTFKQQPEGSGGAAREISRRKAFKVGGRGVVVVVAASERVLMCGNSWHIRGIRT